MYYPKNQIKTNLYTNGGEFVLKSTKEPYMGFYWSTAFDTFFTGKGPQDLYEELIPIQKTDYTPTNKKYSKIYIDKPVIDYINVKNNVSSLSELKKEIPLYYYPQPTEEDYNNGYFYRYFCKKANENLFIEVNKQTYEEINSHNSKFDFSMFIAFRLSWVLIGDVKKVEQENIKTVSTIERVNKYFGFVEYFKDYTQFWKP